MQNIYINSLQIHSNTTDIGYVVYNPDTGMDFPEVRLTKYFKPGDHGAVVANQLYGGRPIQLNGRISGNTIAQFESNRRALEAALAIVKDANAVSQSLLLKFLTMDNLSLQAQIYVNNPPQLVRQSLNHALFYLDLYAPDPNFYDQSQQSFTLNIPSGGGVAIPVIFPMVLAAKTGGSVTINNSGDAYSPPVLTITGPLTSPYIANLTTGNVFKVNLTLASSDILVVDMAAKTMVLNGNTNALQYWDSGNTWWKLAPGNNLVTLGSSLSADTGNVQVAFRNAYLGI